MISGEETRASLFAGLSCQIIFAAAAAGWEDGAVFVDGDDQSDLTLVRFEHFGDGRMLGAEAEATGEVETDAGLGFA